MVWWEELTGLQQLFASIAIPTTLVMIVQFVLLLFGFSHGDGADGADAHVEVNLHDGVSHDIFDGHSHEAFDQGHDGAGHGADAHDNADALRLFTLRSIIAFFSIGGWMGVAALGWKLPVVTAVALAFAAGALALYFVAWSIRAALRMQQSGTLVPENAIGKLGEVYIPIPASKAGHGKVSIIVQERLCELEAVTNAERVLKTGETVSVVGVEPEGALVVVPKDDPQEGLMINNKNNNNTGGQ